MSRIAVIGPSLKMGGIERASSTMANCFSQAGHEVCYVAVFRQERFFPLDAPVALVEPPEGVNETRLSMARTVRYLRTSVRAFRPDTVLAYNKFYAAITLVALAGLGVPVYVSDRASPFFRWPRQIAAFNRLVYRMLKPAGAMAQTRVAAEHQARYFGPDVPVRVIPNAIRPVQHLPVERRRQVLAVGRLTDHLKGFDRLVAAWAQVGPTDWKLVFAGGDDDGTMLKAQADDLGVRDRVEFLGRVQDMDRVYAESSIFVIPSRSEGFPNALGEAMAAGLPCISFDFVAGPRDMIEDGENGMLVPEGDIVALADRIRDLMAKPEERERFAAKAQASSRRYAPDVIASEVLSFILE